MKQEIIHISSTQLQDDIKIFLILPEQIKETTKTIYFLHGAMEDASLVIEKANLLQIAKQYQAAIILPSMRNSFYIDVAHEFIVKELISCMRDRYNLSNDKNQTVIGGYSMGGFGAFYNALKCPNLFGTVFSISGAFDISYSIKFVAYLDSALPSYTQKTKQQLYQEYGLTQFLSKDLQQNYYINCGTNDILLFVNHQFIRELDKYDIPYTYKESDGNHDWIYWKDALRDAFQWIYTR